MHVYAEIAARHGVDPKNDDAVDDFFSAVVPTLENSVRVAILQELFGARDGEARPIANSNREQPAAYHHQGDVIGGIHVHHQHHRLHGRSVRSG